MLVAVRPARCALPFVLTVGRSAPGPTREADAVRIVTQTEPGCALGDRRSARHRRGYAARANASSMPGLGLALWLAISSG